MNAKIKLEINYNASFNDPISIRNYLSSINGIEEVIITDQENNCPCCGRKIDDQKIPSLA
jgi:hypothetical protein